ncbi:MAG: SDR family oxidoreductase [Acuticoccus sp.]
MILDKFRLNDRVGVVTGAGSGIGAATAQALAEAGARVVVTDIDRAAAETTAQSLKSAGYAGEALTLDVRSEASVDAAADAVKARFGRVDILVNNAGIAHTNVAAEDTSDEHWRRHMDINLDGVFRCCRAFGRMMLDAGSGSIINIGSMSGIIVNRPQPQAFYNASKAGVHLLTKSLAAEWATRGVRINAVAPTYIETPLVRAALDADPAMATMWRDMTPTGRLGTPEEVAAVIVFLASDASSLMTGSVVVADAGYTCW